MRWLRPRWRKVLRDLVKRPSRTLLVVLSIAVGVVGLGVIVGARTVLSRELSASFAAIRPANATLTTTAPFDDDLVERVRRMPEVGEAEGRRNVLASVEVAPDDWRDLQLNALGDYEDIRLDKVLPQEGAWPPPERELLLERTSMALLGVEIGDTLRIRTPAGVERDMRVAGSTHDQYALVYALDGVAWGNVTFDTFEWLGVPRDYNELRILAAEDADDKAHVESVTARVRDTVEEAGLSLFLMTVPDPGTHPLDTTIQAILGMLGAIGVLALVLSGLLVTNTISALITQQVRQIGMMKAIGGRTRQVATLYLVMVVAFGLMAFLLAIPITLLGTWAFAALVAGFLNFDLQSVAPPASTFALEAVVAILVPLLAAIGPVMRGTRVTVREAISSHGLGRGRYGRGRVDELVERSLERGTTLRRLVPRPVLLSLRNTFRRKARLGLTLATLTAAGAVFMGVFSTQASLLATIDRFLDLWQYDLWTWLETPARGSHVEHAAASVTGIEAVEGWGFESTRIVREEEEDSLGGSMMGFIIPTMLFAPPPDTKLLDPVIHEGRWLLPEDENAVVVTREVINDNPDLGIGDTLTLRLRGRDQDFTIVGVSQAPIPSPMVYVSYDYYTGAVGAFDRAGALMVVTEDHDLDSQARVSLELERALQGSGIDVYGIFEMARERQEAVAALNAIIVLMILVALVVAVVGGLGLTGTMSLNVIERTREIGVMRAIGGATRQVLQIVLVEGLVIGLLSWALAFAISLPLGYGLSTLIGLTLYDAPLTFRFSFTGALVWLVAVLLLSVLASALPGWNATRVSVRDTLAYE